MTVSCPKCGQPMSSTKKRCSDCQRQADMDAVFNEDDKQLAETVDPNLKFAGLLDKATPEQLAALEKLTPDEEKALDSIMAQELRLYGTRVRFGRVSGVDREYIQDGLLKGFEKAIPQIEEAYEKAGKPKFDSRQMIVAILRITPAFLVSALGPKEQGPEATEYRGEPAVFTEDETSPAPAAARTIDSLMRHMPEVFNDCTPGQKYAVEATLKWAWPTENETQSVIKPATVH